jgi:PAS domain S-box-containing protein
MALILEQLVDTLPYCQLDVQGQVVTCSAKVAKMLGYSSADMLGKHISLFWERSPENEAQFDDLLRRTANEGEIKLDTHCKRDNGASFDVEITLAPLHTVQGELFGFSMITLDITQHMQRERSLKERKELFSSTFYQAAVGIVHVRMTDAKFLGANKKICDMLGYTEEEFCTKTIMDVTHPEDILLDMDNTKQMIDGEISMFTIEKRLLRKDGSTVWTKLTATSVSRDENGQAKYGMAVIEDITQIKEAQEALKESEERFKTMADSAPVLIFMTDTEAKNLYVNKNYLNYTGLTYEDVLGTKWQNIIHPLDREVYLGTILQAFHKQEPFRVEFRIKRHDGQFGWILSSGVPRYTPNGLFMGYIGTGIDITDRKFLEESLEQAKLHAERLNRRKSEFLSLMSHELRTPLNSIIGYSRMIENRMAGPLNDNQSKYIGNVVYSGKHLLNIVNDLLDISKVEAGKMKIFPTVFELAPLMEDIRAMLVDLANKKGVVLLFNTQSDLSTIEADPARFKQILINLISNAIKFNHSGGKVLVNIFKREDEKWLIGQVQDTGIGIPKNKLDNLFSTFYQVDSSDSRSHEGTGLGLALTKELIELHGGKIEIETQEGVGSTFTFSLPSSLHMAERDINDKAASYSSH